MYPDVFPPTLAFSLLRSYTVQLLLRRPSCEILSDLEQSRNPRCMITRQDSPISCFVYRAEGTFGGGSSRVQSWVFPSFVSLLTAVFRPRFAFHEVHGIIFSLPLSALVIWAREFDGTGSPARVGVGEHLPFMCFLSASSSPIFFLREFPRSSPTSRLVFYAPPNPFHRPCPSAAYNDLPRYYL